MSDAYDLSSLKEILADAHIPPESSKEYVDHVIGLLQEKIRKDKRDSAPVQHPLFLLPEDLLSDIVCKLPTVKDKLNFGLTCQRASKYLSRPEFWPNLTLTLDIRDQRESQWRFLKSKITEGMRNVIITLPYGRSNRQERAPFENKLVTCLTGHRGDLQIINSRSRHLEHDAPLMTFMRSNVCAMNKICLTNGQILHGKVTINDLTIVKGADVGCSLVRGEVIDAKMHIQSWDRFDLNEVYSDLNFDSTQEMTLYLLHGCRRLPAMPAKLKSLTFGSFCQYYPGASTHVRLSPDFEFSDIKAVPRLTMTVVFDSRILHLENLVKLNLLVSNPNLNHVAADGCLALDLRRVSWPALKTLEIRTRPNECFEIIRDDNSLGAVENLSLQYCILENIRGLKHLKALDMSTTFVNEPCIKTKWQNLLAQDWSKMLPDLDKIHLTMPNFHDTSMVNRLSELRRDVYKFAYISMHYNYSLIGRRSLQRS